MAIFSITIKVKLTTIKMAKNNLLINLSLNKKITVPKANAVKNDDFSIIHKISKSDLVRQAWYIPLK